MHPYMKELIEMSDNEEIPTLVMAAFAVKVLSKWGSQSDFDNLPDKIKENMKNEINKYKQTGTWVLIQSNSEGENYGPYADDVISRIDLKTSDTANPPKPA
jgi:hypothetical protein